MKQNKLFAGLDERNKILALKIVAIMYFITVIAIQGIVIYRQFALGQSIGDFEDIAIIMVFNSVFLISALLYFGVLPIQKLKIKTILSVYALIVILGTVFTYAKYNIFQSTGLSAAQLFDKLIIIFSISGLLVLFFVMFSYLGKRKLERELEED